MTLALVIPCFDEGDRLDVERLVALGNHDDVSLVFVDDGSTDDTLDRLHAIERRVPGSSTVALPRNVGKGEAVRHGLQHARTLGTTWVGYLDADLATPPEELLRLLAIADARPHLDVVMGSRVALLGRSVRRSPFRHYTGRVFATLASELLDIVVYDTQCGAKVIRAGDELDAAIAVPFRSRWAFDVELLGRLHRSGVPLESIWEEPLLEWTDASSSHRSLVASLRTVVELAAIRRDLDRWDERE